MTKLTNKTLSPIERDIQHAIPIVASAYAERFGIRVTIGGPDAFTNGQLINLPLLNENTVDMAVYWGYLAHEAAHCRFTNFRIDKPEGATGFLLNVIEDVRIEKLFEQTFPGTKVDLEAVMDNADSQGLFIPDPTADQFQYY